MRAVLVVLAAAALCGCLKQPDYYAPPGRREPLPAEVPPPLRYYTSMSDADAGAHFVSGVLPELHDGKWRWCAQQADLSFGVPKQRGLDFEAVLTVPEITFRQTGPVKIDVFLNAHRLGTANFETPGEQRFRKSVPGEWLGDAESASIRFSADKEWVAELDGARRGFILTAAGFVQ